MGVAVRWEDENGGELGAVLDPGMCISHLVLNADLSGTICLRFIDPYGDTTFNQLQIPTLINELESIMKNTEDELLREHLLRVLELAKRSTRAIHTYLKFYGD